MASQLCPLGDRVPVLFSSPRQVAGGGWQVARAVLMSSEPGGPRQGEMVWVTVDAAPLRFLERKGSLSCFSRCSSRYSSAKAPSLSCN